jgi:hypothetical protein
MRKPDLIIGPASNPQTLRWHIFKWRGWQLALHKWCRSDDDRALHDHSGHNVSLILTGGYFEVLQGGVERFRWPLVPYFRRADLPHCIKLPSGGKPVWTLWLRWPPSREWGFHCPKGWRHWKEYTSTRDYSAPGSISEVGPGCD